MKKATLALLALGAFFCLEWLARSFNIYKHFSLIDIPLHFLGGIAIATILMLIYNKKTKFILWFTLIFGILFEVVEMSYDYLFPAMNPTWLMDVFFWDGVTDILVKLFGAGLACAILIRYKRKLK